MTGIKFIVIFTVAAFDLAIVPGSVRTYQLMPNAKLLRNLNPFSRMGIS